MKTYESLLPRRLAGAHQQCLVGNAAETPLRGQSATVVYGEAMLTMQGTEQKHRIVHEAARLLQPGGRYGIHELCLVPDELDAHIKREIEQAHLLGRISKRLGDREPGRRNHQRGEDHENNFRVTAQAGCQ